MEISWPGEENINLLFTGDYNNKNLFFSVPELPEWVRSLPLTIVQECTYGNTSSSSIEYNFEENIERAVFEEKTIVIPVFSLGRSQELMYTIKKYQDANIINSSIPCFFDGPLGRKYTSLYTSNKLEVEVDDFIPRNFHYVSGNIQRSEIIKNKNIKIILTTSGMASHGPAQEYFPRLLSNPKVLFHFTGYLAENTFGREVLTCPNNGIVTVKGMQKQKNAEVKTTSEFSGHAKSDQLLDFLKGFKRPELILLNHGSKEAQKSYSKLVIDELNPKNLGLLNSEYVIRVDSHGLLKTIPSKLY